MFSTIIRKYGKIGVFFILFVSIFLMILVESLILNNSRNKFEYEGLEFTFVEEVEDKYLFEDQSGRILTFELVTYKVNPTQVYKEFEKTYCIVYYNGEVIYEGPSDLVVASSFDSNPPLYSKAYQAVDKINKKILIPIVLISTFLGAIGLGNLLFPVQFWKLNNFLSVRGGEPTDLYLFTAIISSIIIILFSIVFPLLMM